ncbi:helix-turn-helix domain-containing protein [Amycolatopsis sp. lyj-90]|uniref:helix-turn-helix domain-containing protein n=1 Tax=Amycolatopsis sp. lyj-90 TaxID=2789285 RepID=UPI00397853D1
MADPGIADEQLRALLGTLKTRSGLTYVDLAKLASCSHGAAQKYVTKPGHERGESTLKALLTALGADDVERAEALRLLKLTRPDHRDPAQVTFASAAAAAECTVWEMERFTPAEATVHTAIDRGAYVPGRHHAVTPPPYVPRVHDTALRADIAAAAAGDLSALIVVRGDSSTGKTRSLHEAVHALCPDWAVVRPRSAAALRGLAASGLVNRRPCVLWLNDLRKFLGSDGTGLSLDVLRDLLAVRRTRPVVAVGSLWAETLRDAIAEEDRHSDNIDLLTTDNEWVRWHDVPSDLLTSERVSARELATGSRDARLDEALADRDRVGFAQTLAGAYELLQRYTNAPHRLNRLVLDAAADSHRLGHTHALSAPLLRDIAIGWWREERGRTSPPDGWFDDALAYATKPFRSTQGVQALIPLDDAAGYDLADYLDQHLQRVRLKIPPPDAFWEACLTHAPDAQAHHLGKRAYQRLLYGHAIGLQRRAADDGDVCALAEWAAILRVRDDLDALTALSTERAEGCVFLQLARLHARRRTAGPAKRAWHQAGAADRLGQADAVLADIGKLDPQWTAQQWRDLTTAGSIRPYRLITKLAELGLVSEAIAECRELLGQDPAAPQLLLTLQGKAGDDGAGIPPGPPSGDIRSVAARLHADGDLTKLRRHSEAHPDKVVRRHLTELLLTVDREDEARELAETSRAASRTYTAFLTRQARWRELGRMIAEGNNEASTNLRLHLNGDQELDDTALLIKHHGLDTDGTIAG